MDGTVLVVLPSLSTTVGLLVGTLERDKGTKEQRDTATKLNKRSIVFHVNDFHSRFC